MTTFVLIPGAGGNAWYWHRVEPVLRAAGHDVVAVDLPSGDDRAGLEQYTDVVLAAVGQRRDLVVVGQSLGGLTAPLICEHRPVRLLVLLNAMIARPGETGGQWWEVTGQAQAREQQAVREGRQMEFDPIGDFFHDLPDDVAEQLLAQGEPMQSDRPMADPWPLKAWPPVPTRLLAGRDDRFFPLSFQQRVARERLNLAVDEIPGGHLAALSQPEQVASHLLRYLAELPT